MSLSTIIKRALNCDSVSISRANMVEVKSIQEWSDSVEVERRLATDKSNFRAFSFVKLTPVKFDKRNLFGSHVKSDCAQELSVCPAIKNSEGDWSTRYLHNYRKLNRLEDMKKPLRD